jgi:hypothetical protein
MAMKLSDLNKIIENEVTKRLDEYTNDLADIINEAIDIKLSKMLLKEGKKVSLKEQILQKAGGASSEHDSNDTMAEIAFGERNGNNESLMNKMKTEFNTGIFDGYGGKKASTRKQEKQYTSTKALNEVSGNIKDYAGNKDAMIDDLANVDYTELLD